MKTEKLKSENICFWPLVPYYYYGCLKEYKIKKNNNKGFFQYNGFTPGWDVVVFLLAPFGPLCLLAKKKPRSPTLPRHTSGHFRTLQALSHTPLSQSLRPIQPQLLTLLSSQSIPPHSDIARKQIYGRNPLQDHKTPVSKVKGLFSFNALFCQQWPPTLPRTFPDLSHHP